MRIKRRDVKCGECRPKSLHAAEINHRPVNVDIDLPIQLAQRAAQLFLGLEGWRKQALFGQNVFHKPVCSPAFSADIEAGDKIAAGFQNAPCFGKGLLLIGEGVEAVHADDDIKGFIRHGQTAHIALNASDMRLTVQPFLGLFKHIRAVIQTGDARVFQGCPFALREHGRSDRNIQQSARKIVGNIGQDLSGDGVVIRAAPKEPDIHAAEKVPLREHVVINVFGSLVSVLNFIGHVVHPVRLVFLSARFFHIIAWNENV